MSICCGIDFGCTHSSIAYYNTSAKRVQPVWIPGMELLERQRSSIAWSLGGDVSVGGAALNALGSERACGYPELLRAFARRAPAEGGDEGEQKTAADGVAAFIGALVVKASEFADDSVRRLVIATPSCVGVEAREGIVDVCSASGAESITVIPALQAIAFSAACGQQSAAGKHLLVVHMGTNVFEVGIVRAASWVKGDDVEAGQPELLCYACDEKLGGAQWTDSLVQWVRQKNNGVYVEGETDEGSPVRLMLRESCEAAKIQLDRLDGVSLAVGDPLMPVSVSPHEFGKATTHLAARFMVCVSSVLAYARREYGVQREAVGCVLSGGGTRLPLIRKHLEESAGSIVPVCETPERVVLAGATMAASREALPFVSCGVDVSRSAEEGHNTTGGEPSAPRKGGAVHKLRKWLGRDR